MIYQLLTSQNFSSTRKYIFNFDRFFFNEPPHLQQQGGENFLTFYWLNVDNQVIDARLNVIILCGNGFSPLKATFGGVEFSKTLSQELLFDFLDLSLKSCLNISYLKITFCPECYLDAIQIRKIDFCIKHLKVQEIIIDENFHINISNQSFHEVLKSVRHKQLLRKSIRENFQFKEIDKPDLLEIYEFIARSRKRKNRPMTMEFEHFKQSIKSFPENFILFSVIDNNILIAVAVCIKISDEILYTFYLADDERYLKSSPLIFLLSGIYDYCKQMNYHVLDIGIASEKGILNEGLAKFKLRLGAQKSFRKTVFLRI